MNDYRNTYTNAPALHPNLVVGSLQIIAWLLFHPSAWRHYVARTLPNVSTDFCLAELNHDQWRHPQIRRLLWVGGGVYPLLIGLLAGPIYTGLAYSGLMEMSVFTSLYPGYVSLALIIVGYMLASFLIIGTIVSVSTGFVYSVVIGLALIVTDALSFGLAAGLAGSVIITTTQNFDFSLRQQLGGFMTGLVIGGITLTPILLNVNRVPGSMASNNALGPSIATGILGSLILVAAIRVRTQSWKYMLWSILLFSVTITLMYYLLLVMNPQTIIRRLPLGLIGGLFFGTFWAIPYLAAKRITGPVAGAVVGSLFGGTIWVFVPQYFGRTIPIMETLPFSFIIIIAALTVFKWRPALSYPFLMVYNALLYSLDQRRSPDQPSLLGYHSAFWDEHQWLPLFGLDSHLALVVKRNPEEGTAAMEYLAATPQRWATQVIQIELKFSSLERCRTIQTIAQIYKQLTIDGEMQGRSWGFLRRFGYISQDIEAALKRATPYHQRQSLGDVRKELHRLREQLSSNPKSSVARFQALAQTWYEIVDDHIDTLVAEQTRSQKIENPYIYGPALTDEDTTFIKRTQAIIRLEQLLLNRHHPPLLLYGQRRMGKTSLLQNLGRSLPRAIVPLFIDGQGSATAGDYGEFFSNIIRQMRKSAKRQALSLPDPDESLLATSPLTGFDCWLDAVEVTLDHEDRQIAVLMLDEFEAVDRVIDKGRFDAEDVLGLLRNVVQHRPRFRVLLAGSHTLEEFKRWASYLINFQVIEISYLEPDEARRLIETPVEGFELRYEPAALDAIIDVTRGHPFLVQQLCYEIVELKNEQAPDRRRLATLADVEVSVAHILSAGHMFFEDIEHHQISPAERDILRFIAVTQDAARPVSRDRLITQVSSAEVLDEQLTNLKRRFLIEAVEGGYQFQVELIRRWFVVQV